MPKRVRSRKAVAEAFGVTERAVGYWKKEDWWQSEFQTSAGYDLEAIRLARAANAEPQDLTEKRLKIRIAKEQADLEIKWTELRRKQREEQLALGNTLPADVYTEFLRELLGMIRERLEDLPFRLSRQASAAQKKLIYVPESKIKKPSDAAPLQRMVAKIIDDVQKWLDQGAEEVKQSD